MQQNSNQSRWDGYAGADDSDTPGPPAAAPPPSPGILRFAARMPAGGSVLDLACGAGRHSRLFLDRGHPVTAVDRDLSRLGALADHPDLETLQCDLETGDRPAFLERPFDGIVVTNYLFRPLFPALLGALAPGGLLLYETFARGNERFGRPSNPDFLLTPGELLTWLHPQLQVLAYEILDVSAPQPAMGQRIAALRPADPAADD